jgi:hypothetical protein
MRRTVSHESVERSGVKPHGATPNQKVFEKRHHTHAVGLHLIRGLAAYSLPLIRGQNCTYIVDRSGLPDVISPSAKWAPSTVPSPKSDGTSKGP